MAGHFTLTATVLAAMFAPTCAWPSALKVPLLDYQRYGSSAWQSSHDAASTNMRRDRPEALRRSSFRLLRRTPRPLAEATLSGHGLRCFCCPHCPRICLGDHAYSLRGGISHYKYLNPSPRSVLSCTLRWPSTLIHHHHHHPPTSQQRPPIPTHLRLRRRHRRHRICPGDPSRSLLRRLRQLRGPGIYDRTTHTHTHTHTSASHSS